MPCFSAVLRKIRMFIANYNNRGLYCIFAILIICNNQKT